MWNAVLPGLYSWILGGTGFYLESKYTSVKLLARVKERLEAYAKPRGLTLSAAVADLLDKADVNERLDKVVALLEEQNRLLREHNELLRRLLEAIRAGPLAPTDTSEEALELRTHSAQSEEPLPSFVEDNPWLQVIASRGRQP